MQRTKSKILSILLSLVMLLSLLPTTALATTYNDVKVNGVSLGDGEYLTSNAATAASSSSTEPTTYVAWYKNGVLTLNNFTGKSNSGIVLQGAPAADLIIKLIGNNTITPYDTGIQGNSAAGSITITADSDSNGKLTINMPNSERSAFGINGSANSVTISGSADVTIIATATATNQESYGIKSSKAVSILDSASVSITCKTPNSTSRSDSCNGIYSDTGVTINTDGTIQIDVHEAGNEAYSYGINSMGTLTLTKVGEMTVKWKKASMQGAPLSPSSASFDPNAYDTHMDTTDTTNCIATYMPKVSATITSVSATVSQPVKGYPLDTSVNVYGATAYTADVMWKADGVTASGNALADTVYTALITLTAKEGESFSSSLNNTTTPGGYAIEWHNSTELMLTKEFDRTNLKDATGITIDNTTLTVAVPKAEPNTEQKAELPLTAKVNYDDGTHETVDAFWSFVDSKPEGVDIDKDTGKLTVTNKAAGGTVEVKAAYNGMTDTKTVTITKDTLKPSAIVATAPAGGTNITIPNGGTNTSGSCSYMVYDQYGAAMPSIGATWKMEPETVAGVTLTSTGGISVNNTATTGTVKLYAESGGVKSNEITFNIARAASVPTSLTIEGSADSVNVPTVTEPGTTKCAYASYTAKVKDQYGAEMTGQTIEWSFTEKPGVTFNNGQLTVSNKASAGAVTITAKCGTLTATKTVTINKAAAEVSIVKITAQDNEPPVTTIICTGSQRTESYTATVYDQYGKEIQDDVTWSLDPATYSGVHYEIPGTNNNIVTLKVAPTAAVGTFKLVATSKTIGTVKGELEITVQQKTDVSSNINFDNGSLTYTGAGQKYEKATLDSSVTPGTGEKWTYTYTAGTGTLDTATGLPKTVGTYTVTATYEDSSNIGSKSATLKITPREVAIPAPDTTVYTYDGTAKTYNIPTSPYYTVSGNKQTNANEGGYPVTVALTDTANTTWPGGNTGVQIYYFKIMRATPSGEPTYTEITTSGKKLSDAGLTTTGGTFSVSGTVKWVDDTTGADLLDTTTVEANKLYKWVFTPSDTANYKPLTGTIKLWNKSTSSGGYYYAPTAAVVPDMPMLYRGCTGDAVKTLQDKLNALGYNSGSVDGIFGAKTYAAVTAFQKANSLGVDGIVGKLT